MKGVPPIDEKALSSGAKGLRGGAASSSKGASSPADQKEAKNILSSLEELYDKFDGKISQIFASLNESPRKALKHPPKDAKDFAKKYYEGYYADIDGAPSTAPGK